MALPADIKEIIQNFVVRHDRVGLCTWLYETAQSKGTPLLLQYIHDPEFADVIVKNDEFTIGVLDWLLQKDQPPEASLHLEYFLYFSVYRKMLNSAQRIIHITQNNNPEILVASTQIAPKKDFPPAHEFSEYVLKLLHLYAQVAHLGRWRPAGAIQWTYRDEDLAADKNKVRLDKHTQWLNLILESIFLFDPLIRPYFQKQHPEQKIIDYYHRIAQEYGRYYSDDHSDDSDSDDEVLLNSAQHANVTRRKQLLRKKAITEQNDFRYQTDSGYIHTRNFWLQTRRTTPKNKGLEDKISTTGKVTEAKVDAYIDNLKDDVQQRPATSANPSKNKKRFVAQVRGVNYMSDRWSIAARRAHAKIDEIGLPQLSESVLKNLPFDIYTELNESGNFIAQIKRLAGIAEGVHHAYQNLTHTGYVIERTFTDNGSLFLFNNRNDFLQQRYSNGISEHLSSLNTMRTQHPELKDTLINTYNYGISTANRVYHAGKYAGGLKDYYPFNFKPYYDMQGRPLHSHGGKIYIILYELEDFLKSDTASRVLLSLNQGRTPIRQNIVFELETTFVGRIPGDKVVHQEIFKFPSFHKDYKPIYETKYGLSPTLYSKFQYLIRSTRPESPERDKVLTLLAEWLCAYYEVLLVRIAEQCAHERNGILEYIDHNNISQMKADSSPLTNGGGHLHDRNRVHVLQNLRWELGAALNDKKLITQQDVEQEIQNILKDPARLRRVYVSVKGREGVDLPDVKTLNQQGDESEFYEEIHFNRLGTTVPDALKRTKPVAKLTDDAAMTRIATAIINTALKNGLFSSQMAVHLTLPAHSKVAATTTPHWRKSHLLTQANYLYQDYQITTLLQYYLQAPGLHNQPAVFAAMHPLVTGPGTQMQRTLFLDTLRSALLTDQTAVIPINLTTEYIGIHNLPAMAGTHWVGVIVRTDGTQRRLFYVDSLNNPIPATLQVLIDAIRDTLPLLNVSLQQQGADVDCGAWTVDNLRRLALAPTINTAAEAQAVLRPAGVGVGQTLRQEHNQTNEQIYPVHFGI